MKRVEEGGEAPPSQNLGVASNVILRNEVTKNLC